MPGLLETILRGIIEGEAAPRPRRRRATPRYGPSEVVGPLPSQSSVPSIRSIGREKPSIASLTGLLKEVDVPEDPESAYSRAVLSGVPPSRTFGRFYGEKARRKILGARMKHYIAPREGLKEDPLAELVIGSVATGGLGLLGRGALAGLGLAQAGSSAGRGAGALSATLRGGKTVTRGGAKAATFPIRHPIATTSAPAVAEIPAATRAGDPGQFVEALEGTGTLASILGSAASSVRDTVPGVAGNALSDLLELPAQVLPSAYLTGKAGVEAIQGDTESAEKLIEDFTNQSALYSLATGNLGEAASRAGKHPLYTALEAAGIKAATGRGAGAVARIGALGPRIAELAAIKQRAPLKVYGDIEIQRGSTSPDLFNALVQRATDAKTAGRGNVATQRQARRYLPSRFNRTIFAGEQARRGAVGEADQAMQAVRERAGSSETADVAALAIQKIARNPETALADLRAYRDSLVAEQANLAGGRLRANKATVERIDKALGKPDVEGLMAAASQFIERQNPVQRGLQERGIYAPEQTERASALGFLRTHEGATYGKPEGSLKGQILTKEGEPMTTEAIREALKRQGADEPGFISNRPGELGRGAYYQPSTTRPPGVGQRASGKAIAEGTADTGFEAISQQFIGATSRLQQAKNFDNVTKNYGLAKSDGSYFKSTAEAQQAIENPADFGLQLPDVPGGWTTRRVTPFPTRSAELEAAKGYGAAAAAEPDVPQTSLGDDFMTETIQRANMEGDGPVVLVPASIAKLERQHFAEKLPIEKTAEAVTGLFKGAILPTSPGWLLGNVADMYGIRTPIAGITLGDIRTGKKLGELIKKELTPEEATLAMESMVPGGIFGHVNRMQPYRAAEQFVGTKLEPLWRAATTIRNLSFGKKVPGPKTVGDLYKRYRDAVYYVEGKYIEQLPQYGALSRQARKDLGMSRRAFRKAVDAQEPVILDLVKGFRDQDHIDRFAKSIEDVYGNWGKNGPEARRFLNTWAPFWQFARAATKLAFVTLPRDHPVLTGLIAASEQMTREERENFGLGEGVDEALPAFLQGGIPLPNGSVVKLSNLTSFGAFADYPDFLASMAGPQFSPFVLSGLGIEWTGDRLTDSDGRPARPKEKLLTAALSGAGAFIPFFNVTQQVIDKGFKGANPLKTYDPSVVKFLREEQNSQQISIPVTKDSEATPSNPWDSVGLGEGSGNPWDAVDLEAGSSNPWDLVP